jgi:hypothetical protein
LLIFAENSYTSLFLSFLCTYKSTTKTEDIPCVEKQNRTQKKNSSKTTHYRLHVTYGIPMHHLSPTSLKLHKTFENKHFTKHLKTKTSQNKRCNWQTTIVNEQPTNTKPLMAYVSKKQFLLGSSPLSLPSWWA